MLDIGYVALLDFFVRIKRISNKSRSRFYPNRPVAPFAPPEGAREYNAARRDEPSAEKSTRGREAS